MFNDLLGDPKKGDILSHTNFFATVTILGILIMDCREFFLDFPLFSIQGFEDGKSFLRIEVGEEAGDREGLHNELL